VSVQNGKISPKLFAWFAVPGLLLLIAIVAYGLSFRRMGFFWDDWWFLWIAKSAGPEGLVRYFSTNRPFYGQIVALTTSLLGTSAWQWQLFGIFCRWLSAVALWMLLSSLWPHDRRPALWAALFFLVFPGFYMQSIGINFGHFYLIFSCLLFSWVLSIRAQRDGKRYWLYTIPALLLSLVNLLAMEYFFVLELLRVALHALALQEDYPRRKDLLKHSARATVPYWVLFILVVLWRVFFFQYQNTNYEYSLLSELKAAPLAAVWGLIRSILTDTWFATGISWAQVFRFPAEGPGWARIMIYFSAVVVIASGVVFAFLHLSRRPEEKTRRVSPYRDAIQLIGLGIAALLLAGWPFWLVKAPVSFDFPYNRFVIPFMLGSALLLAGLIALLAARLKSRAWVASLLVALVVGLSVGRQYQNQLSFRQDWNEQQRFFQQLVQRVPGLSPGTMLLSNELFLKYESDNSLNAPLNWIYDPGYSGGDIAYAYEYPTLRLGKELPSLAPGTQVRHDFLTAVFPGSTDRVLGFYYQVNRCLRILDPEIDTSNPNLDPLQQQTATLSNTDLILPDGEAVLPNGIFTFRENNDWCSYFERIDLARQQQDWQKAAALSSEALEKGLVSNQVAERLPLIEAFAHTGDWQKAIELSTSGLDPLAKNEQPLCLLWQRIGRDVPESPEKLASLEQISTSLGCSLKAIP
jgi:uncharacterized membrane protein YidH (DUF202 family)